jgi:hypothetical protein
MDRMKRDETVKFKHFKPVIYTAIHIIWIAIIALSAYFLLKNATSMMEIQIVLLPVLLMLVYNFTVGKKLRDMPGKFICSDNCFEIRTFSTNAKLYYSDIVEIRKECYNKSVNVVIISGTQVNPGQYSIHTKQGKKYVFRISENEEKDYSKKIDNLSRKIFKTNSLGVHFNTKKFRDRLSSKEKEIQFEKERPVPNYSLENAIKKILEKSNLELNDTTIDSSINNEKDFTCNTYR